MNSIKICIGKVVHLAKMYNTASAQAIYDALPLSGKINLWGNEIYFIIPVSQQLEEDSKQEVEIGELGYWPEGPAFCIFYGTTRVSKGNKPMAYSRVNIFGKIEGDLLQLKQAKNGEKIVVEKF